MQYFINDSVRLGTFQSYSVEGDVVELDCELRLPYPGAKPWGWILQLWACHQPPANRAAVRGWLVGETPLDFAQIPPGACHIHARLPAVLPASGRSCALVLALARPDAAGVVRIHDWRTYPNRCVGASLQLTGAVDCSVADQQLTLRAGGVLNPRPTVTSSGTLALELWSTSAPYAGGSLTGHQLGVATLGCLDGGCVSPHICATVPLLEPLPGGARHAVIVLREWTANGPRTRDFRNLDARFEAPLPVPAATPADPVEAPPDGGRVSPLVAAST